MAAHHPERIAPVHMHNPGSASSSSSSMQQFTVGKLDAGMAILLGSRASLIEFPSLLLPQDVTSGSVVEITVRRNIDQERKNQRDLEELQHNILETFGKIGPVAPELRLRAVTQTSVVLEWSRLGLATANLIALDIYRNGTRLAPIPNPLHNTSTKLSGLEVGADYAFHLVLKTTAGTMTSNLIRTKTHAMTDTSGIAVCFGAIEGELAEPSDLTGGEAVAQLEELSRDLVAQMGAKASTKLQIDTTHYVCTSPRARNNASTGPANGAGEGPTYRKALQLNIPVVRPEWIVACWEAKKMVPIAPYYIDKDPPNHSSVRGLLSKRGARQSLSEQRQPATTSSAATSTPAGAETDTATGSGLTEKEQPPPPPAPKDPPREAQASSSSSSSSVVGESVPTVSAPPNRALEEGEAVAEPEKAQAQGPSQSQARASEADQGGDLPSNDTTPQQSRAEAADDAAGEEANPALIEDADEDDATETGAPLADSNATGLADQLSGGEIGASSDLIGSMEDVSLSTVPVGPKKEASAGLLDEDDRDSEEIDLS